MFDGRIFVDERRKQLVEVLKSNDGNGDHFACLVKLYASDDEPYWTRWVYLSDEITNAMEILAWVS
jgi:hypothetical protein